MTARHAPGAVGRARHLRQIMTLPEKKLWKELRRLDLNIRRQATIGRYVVDFASHAAALVVEIDGGLHALPDAQLHDLERTEWLTGQGYRVPRFRNEEVLADPVAVAETIAAAMGRAPAPPALDLDALAQTPPSPTLRPSRGKGTLIKPLLPRGERDE
jgi:very-short-patch-repair endonuclease